MKTSTLAGVLALAASTTAQFNNQTKPFALVVLSKNETYNGTTLAACHEGAGIEGLCVGPSLSNSPAVSTFTFNYSTSYPVDPAIGTVGYLTYELEGFDFNLSSPMSLENYPVTNVAVPLFGISYGTEVTFKHDFLGIPSSIDDTVTPPVDGANKNYYRWYICETFAGYDYTTLAWVMGNTKPQNPSCVKAEVKRLFV